MARLLSARPGTAPAKPAAMRSTWTYRSMTRSSRRSCSGSAVGTSPGWSAAAVDPRRAAVRLRRRRRLAPCRDRHQRRAAPPARLPTSHPSPRRKRPMGCAMVSRSPPSPAQFPAPVSPGGRRPGLLVLLGMLIVAVSALMLARPRAAATVSPADGYDSAATGGMLIGVGLAVGLLAGSSASAAAFSSCRPRAGHGMPMSARSAPRSCGHRLWHYDRRS